LSSRTHIELCIISNADNIYPRVFLSTDDLDTLSKIEADLIPFVERKRAEWITNGKAEEEWEEYLLELERLGFSTWLEIKQNGYNLQMEGLE